MKRTGAWLVRYALEQLGIRYTFGIPGVHNTELYDELDSSESILPILVTHEANGSFMAEAAGRVSDSVGVMLIIPGAGAAYAAAGIGEAFLDGVPLLVIAAGVRTDTQYHYQVHEIDQQALLAPITKKVFKISHQEEVVPTLFSAYEIATSGEPGPVFVEVPVNIQLFTADVDDLPVYRPDAATPLALESSQIDEAAQLLLNAEHPGLFLGWGAARATDVSIQIADFLNSPVATTLQGLSVFPANHPLHAGMSFGRAAVPAAENAFRHCDVLLAVGTRFGEPGTCSYGLEVPDNLIHIDINSSVFNKNYPARVAILGDSRQVLGELWKTLQRAPAPENRSRDLRSQIEYDKAAYRREWERHESGDRVNPATFFAALREQLTDDAYVISDDGNHTYLTAELMPIHASRHFISPTDFNCMGYCVPAAIAAKMMHPEAQVVGIVGDGSFLMTCMEIVTAATHRLGAVFFVFHDGELSQIAQAQELPYNRKTCTVLGSLDVAGVAQATGARFLSLKDNAGIPEVIAKALELAEEAVPVLVDVNIDYSKRTRFTTGVAKTNLLRFPLKANARFALRALRRHRRLSRSAP